MCWATMTGFSDEMWEIEKLLCEMEMMHYYILSSFHLHTNSMLEFKAKTISTIISAFLFQTLIEKKKIFFEALDPNLV